MKPISKRIASVLLCGTALATLAGCGGGGSISIAESSTKFLFSAAYFAEDGVNYKLNLKGLEDKTCTLVCAQASPKIEYSGKWEFDAAKGYSFDFGSSLTLLSGYNAFSQEHYSLYTAKLNDNLSLRLMMTLSDSEFKPGANYVDPYDTVAGEHLYTGTITNSDEVIKLRDYNDGTFDLMSFGSSAIFDYGKYAEEGGKRVYTLSDGATKLTRDVGQGNENYRVTYPVSSGKSTVDTLLYHLSGDLDADHAFPDPRGDKVHIFNVANTTEFAERNQTMAPGSVKGELVLWRNETSQEYELQIDSNGSSWLNETGTWVATGKDIVFTSSGQNPTVWNGSLDGFDREITKEGSKGGDPTVVTFHFAIAA